MKYSLPAIMLALTACQPDPFPAPGPVMASELEGKWCDPRPGQLLCLEAYAGETYAWSASDCYETGWLSGGLEFSPFHGDCFALGSTLYSAAVQWRHGGLVLDIDGQLEPLYLSYVSQE